MNDIPTHIISYIFVLAFPDVNLIKTNKRMYSIIQLQFTWKMVFEKRYEDIWKMNWKEKFQMEWRRESFDRRYTQIRSNIREIINEWQNTSYRNPI